MNCGIFRYHPVTEAFDVVAEGTTNPWGHDWDEHGQLFFINTVIGHLWHGIPGARYKRMYGNHFEKHLYELIPQTADHYHWAAGNEDWGDLTGLSPLEHTWPPFTLEAYDGVLQVVRALALREQP